ncbi:uracil-DNA glycosylase family protein [Thalassococcus sp. S3]|uniref:uracil-DNA glycosylase family protein n=1 Tax=Thalassococcus sp. S3 TaxID=2017482 RepID=UPI00102BCCEC|nr:uracil-DNA glycosylase family protein [Thalassococcus sp. S3]
MTDSPDRHILIARRRAFTRPGYVSYAEAGFDGPWVSPYQQSCGSTCGPVLISYNWLDAPSARTRKVELMRLGYLPDMLFNRVLDRALADAGLARNQIYLTHAFHLLPATRSAQVPRRDIEASFDAITRHEVAGRPVIALGRAAQSACCRFGIPHLPVSHPSARGANLRSKAAQITMALQNLSHLEHAA